MGNLWEALCRVGTMMKTHSHINLSKANAHETQGLRIQANWLSAFYKKHAWISWLCTWDRQSRSTEGAMETCLWWTTRKSRMPWGIQRSGGARPHAPAVDPDRWDITVVPNMPACLIPWENPWFLGGPGPCWPVGCCFFWSSNFHL